MIGSSRSSLAGFVLAWIFTGCGEGAAGQPEQIAEDDSDTEMPSASEPGATQPESAGSSSGEDLPEGEPMSPAAADPGAGGAPAGVDPATGEPEDPAQDKVGVFVAQGHLGRTVMSCDAGKTWIHDRADITDNRCWTDDGIECDHQSTSGRGLTFAGDAFYATFGWGLPGSIRRSGDGHSWETVHEGSTFGGIEFGAGTILAGSSNSLISADGQHWMNAGETQLAVSNVRRVGFADHDQGRFLLVGGDADQTDVVLSSDAGNSWWHPDELPTACGAAIQTEGGIAYGNGAIVILGGDGNACASADGGKTWSSNNVGGPVSSHLVFDGTEFFAWGTGTVYRSADGSSWNSQATSPVITPGPTAFGNETFVGVLGGWQTWYEKQEFYRSANGIDWEIIGAGGFGADGHPIRDIAFGWVPRTAECLGPAR